MKSLAQSALDLINGDSPLVAHFAQEPSAMLIPYQQKRESFYLLVSLMLRGPSYEFETVARNCLQTLRILISSGLVAELPGVEIVPYLVTGERTLKLFRLSVQKASYSEAMSLVEQDVLKDHPRPSITCGWYVTKPST